MKKIKGALISVFYKDGLAEIVKELDKHGVVIYSTGGTQTFIEGLGVKAHAVEDLTGYPSILGGRVKTLHPKVFGGILSRRDNDTDIQQVAQYEIPAIDLVIVDLYPFEQTVADPKATAQDIIEKIDIGGISLIRAAAKNFKDVAIVPSVAQYGYILDLLRTQEGGTTLEQRRHLAAEAFNVSSHYDTAIFNYFNRTENIPAFKQSFTASAATHLRYGENPHQAATYFGDLSAQFEQLHGKEISYNNMLDMDAAINLIGEFGGADAMPAFVIMKHNNACGVAVRPTLVEAWKDALAGDPVSAFGGVLITNRTVDKATAEKINEIFFEVIMAPGYDPDALAVLETKKNRIILKTKTDAPAASGGCSCARQFRSLLGGVAVQERDAKVGGQDSEMRQVTNKGITDAEREDLIFANKIVKHSKSNAIVLAKGGMLLASGIGQTSRVDALKQAIAKAKSFGFDLRGAVLASDAFFPFADCAEIAHAEGIDTLIQPGGSVRDQDTIDYCNANGMAMVFTGLRHFKH
ncbi:bifunctional phosphoribosylaminoimidazolecarboxamide formyltransferase/IMP cyclohydrolase [uncultured Rikenella sp.]|uniref:bifunctional phosphoribosylaminoimidazolecarboxamide formyltransferase/IMP cyclohydrolase n=1 Tax=uncultured Rikenella sp. TaxID=368003 RepID=UPI0026203450|nr:bifunctional phosphoribosylaminoimidazolecarboxamide formyltransferase/IMP cyclohydrolase [uncultured Rikenella sp.]